MRDCRDPREIPEVYKKFSPITFAKNLQDHLLLVHGTGDDNVHLQNSERLFDDLVAHDKMFGCLAYPSRSHGIYEGLGARRHLYGALATSCVGESRRGHAECCKCSCKGWHKVSVQGDLFHTFATVSGWARTA
ncbi:MAG: hypothetical protein CMJ89_15480 [Planctomycetes bacterium]|nr:hypothetical protein [Planctomycetota bacterium]